MKKFFEILAFILLSATIFLSCTTETEGGGNTLAYSEFSARKNAWVEPQNYTFKYRYSIGDSYVGAQFVTVVTDGEAVCTANYVYEEKPFSHSVNFNSISELYDYFDSLWKENPSVDTSKKYVLYSGNFKSVENVIYPATLCQSIGVPNTEGYGGECFIINDLSLENHKTFLQKKSAWKEPTGAYSFTYWIFYDEGKTGSYATERITVEVDSDKNATFSGLAESASFFKQYDDISLFGSGDNFCKFSSISEIFDLIETVWKSEESKSAENSNYGIAPIFHAQNSYENYKIPYEFECENFAKNRTSSADSEDEVLYKRIIISVTDFTR